MAFEYRFNVIRFYSKLNRFVLSPRKKPNHFVLKIRPGGFADYTGYGTISADGSLFNSFWKRTVKGINNFTSLFHYKEKYEDEDSNLIK